MTKQEMIEGVLRTGGLTKANVERFYDALVDLTKKRLLADKEFVLPGLGILRVRTRKARMGRNPQTGEAIRIGRRKTVTFKPYRELRLLMNPGLAEEETEAEEPEETAAAPETAPASEPESSPDGPPPSPPSA